MMNRDEILALMQSLGLDQSGLAKAIGVHQPTVSRWLNEEKPATPSPKHEEAMRALMGGASAAPARAPLRRPHLVDPAFAGAIDLPVYAAVEGGPGEMVVSTDPIEWVARPWYLKAVRDGYAVLVIGDSMSPAYEPGDFAVINPRLPAVVGKDAIFTQDDGNGEFRATIKRLVARSERVWKVRQFNPPSGKPAEFELPRALWTNAVRVVGRYSG